MKILFKPLTEGHLGLLHGWLNRPHIMFWWGNEPKSVQEVREKYLPRISGEVPSRSFICYTGEPDTACGDLEGLPIGYIQTHWVADFPEYAEKIGDGLEDNTAAIDVFISDEQNLHKGLGQQIMRQFLDLIVFGEMNAVACTVGPSIENKASIKAYEKAGFVYWKTVDMSQSEREYLLKMTRNMFYEKYASAK